MSDQDFTYEGSLRYSANGTCVLMPWALPYSRNVDGENETQGRYSVAFSRNGWYVLDEEEFRIVRWCASEADAVAALSTVAPRPTYEEECADECVAFSGGGKSFVTGMTENTERPLGRPAHELRAIVQADIERWDRLHEVWNELTAEQQEELQVLAVRMGGHPDEMQRRADEIAASDRADDFNKYGDY